MTVESSVNRIDYNPDGVVNVFPYDFRVDNADDLVVYADGVIITSGYSVSGIGDPSGGNVTFDAAPPGSITVLTFLREVDITQLTHYPAFSSFPSSAHEAALDKLTFLIQQLEERANRALTAAIDEDPELLLQIPGYRAGYIWMWDPLVKRVTTTSINSIITPGSSVGSVINVSELRTKEGYAGQSVFMLYHSTNGDGGQGPWVWDASSTATDNNGTIIQVTGVPVGRWVRSINGPVTLEMFGFQFGSCTSAFMAAVEFLKSTKGGVIEFNSTKKYGFSSTVSIDSAYPITIKSDMRSHDMLDMGYLYPMADLPNGMISFAYSGTPRGHGGAFIVKDLCFTDPLDRNYSIKCALNLETFNFSNIIDCSFENLKGSAITSNYCVMSNIIRPRIRECGDTGLPALNLGGTGAYYTQSVTVQDPIMEVNYSAPYIQLNAMTENIKLINFRGETDTATAETQQNYVRLAGANKAGQLQIIGGHMNRNTETSIYGDASSLGPVITNLVINNNNADGKPKIHILGQYAKLNSILLKNGLTNTGYDVILGSPGSPAYAQVNDLTVNYGAGVMDYGETQYTNIRLFNIYYGLGCSDKFALTMNNGDTNAFFSQASNVSIRGVLTNNHGVYLGSGCLLSNLKIHTATKGVVTTSGNGTLSDAYFYSVSTPIDGTISPTNFKLSNIRGTSGAVYENRGTAATSGGSTVVTHGCSFTPLYGQIQITPLSNATFYASSITSTQFTVTSSVAAASFAWRVIY